MQGRTLPNRERSPDRPRHAWTAAHRYPACLSNASRGQVGLAWKYAPGVVLVSRRNAATNALVVW
jgi:hypothetical protein